MASLVALATAAASSPAAAGVGVIPIGCKVPPGALKNGNIDVIANANLDRGRGNGGEIVTLSFGFLLTCVDGLPTDDRDVNVDVHDPEVIGPFISATDPGNSAHPETGLPP